MIEKYILKKKYAKKNTTEDVKMNTILKNIAIF